MAGRALRGATRVPGDKSVTHRALLLGAVAEGLTEIVSPLVAADTSATAACVRRLGARLEWDEASRGGSARVEGVLDLRDATEPALDCGNAGTAARLLCGLLAGRRGRWALDGDASLRRRPMERVIAPLRWLGARLQGRRLPVAIEGAPLRGGEVVVDVPSAQVKSALLLAGLVAESPLTVVQHGETRDHTERLLPRFGVPLEVEPGRVTVRPARPRAARLQVPGDPSAAAFLLVAAVLVPGSDVHLAGVGLWPRRTGFLRALERAGADVMILARSSGEPDVVGAVRAGYAELSAFDVAPEDVPDLVDEVPILALAAARARGTSRLLGLAELRHKESDRLHEIARLLAALGAGVETTGDALAVTGTPSLRAPPPEWLRHEDHRLALTAAVATLAAGAPLPAEIPAAAISFPGFLATVRELQA